MKRLEETHGVIFELVRHFLGRMMDGEWSSRRGEWQRVAVGAFALLLPAGVLLVREGSLVPSKAGKYGMSGDLVAAAESFRAAALADQLALLTLLFAVTGLLTLMQWQSLFPSRRDYLSLAGLPIRSRQVFAARFTAMMLFSTALVGAMTLAPSFIAPLERGLRWQRNPSYAAHIGAQLEASALGCLFLLLGMVALQGLLLNLLPARLFARISTYVQGLLTALLLLSGLYSWSIRDWTTAMVRRVPEFGSWVPPVWFAGLQQYLLGERDPFYTAMAQRGLQAFGIAAALAVATYLLSYRRYRKLLVEAPVAIEAASLRDWSLARLLSRDPTTQAVLQFMSKTLARSRAHRVIWLAYLGAAIAVMLNSSFIDGAILAPGRHGWQQRALQFVVHFWPLGISVIALNGFHHVLSVPADLAANWIFQLNESQGRRQWMAAVERFILAYAIAPVYLFVFPIAVHALGWPEAVRLIVLQLLITLIVFEIRFYSWQQLPFTCTYVPGTQPMIFVATKYFALLAIFVPSTSFLTGAASRMTGLTIVFAILFGALWIWMRVRRREGWGESKLRFEMIPHASIEDLGLSA